MSIHTKALFDLSVLIDALTNDEQPTPESTAALTLVAQGQVEGYICAAAIESLSDMLTRVHGHPSARAKLLELRSMLDVAPVDAAVIDAAMALGWNYLDDALTHECARANGLDHLITLNPSDFSQAAVAVMEPADFLREVQSHAA